MARYIDDAKGFYQEAVKEFERGVAENNLRVIRDAAEKAWNAIVQATNELMEKRGMPIPRTHHERRMGLLELERSDLRLKEMGFRDRFGAREKYLHEDCFYDGFCPVEVVEEEIIHKVKSYIEDIERI